ncbi:1-phosphatidylinositol phosphodiesterase [Ceratocystis lukuohia]|uniref:1-phosphatidylinositol phosphodiesterase n=1 Tax=Ceratocystis lukuohia TaxID=2019550 RepID=A0ABR4MA91_9PEZI
MRFSVFATLAFLAFSNAGYFNHIEDEWSFDLDEGEQSSWMSRMKDDVPLTQLVIPGTHNSMSYGVENGLFQTQNVPLEQQLLGGIRYIEITCRYIDQKMAVYYGMADTGYSLDSVLTTIYNFLDEYPSETIILRIQKGGMFDFNTFITSMEGYFVPGSDLGDRAEYSIHAGNPYDIVFPTLGEARGKIVILQDFASNPPGRYGIPWGLHTVSNHNSWLSPVGLFLSFKWAAVRYHLNLDRLNDDDKLRITHTTGNLGIRPISVAAQYGNNPGMNELLGRYLVQGEGNCFGIVVMDFPGRQLVEEILIHNSRHLLPELTNLPDQNAIDAVEGADFNYTDTAEEADVSPAETPEEFDFNSISDFEPPPVEDSDDESSDDDYSYDEYSYDENLPTLVR